MVEDDAPEENRLETTKAEAVPPPGTRRRRRLNLRGHIVLDIDEPLEVADSPADPPPVTPAGTSEATPQGT
jgi:hypothetical protein